MNEDESKSSGDDTGEEAFREGGRERESVKVKKAALRVRGWNAFYYLFVYFFHCVCKSSFMHSLGHPYTVTPDSHSFPCAKCQELRHIKTGFIVPTLKTQNCIFFN